MSEKLLNSSTSASCLLLHVSSNSSAYVDDMIFILKMWSCASQKCAEMEIKVGCATNNNLMNFTCQLQPPTTPSTSRNASRVLMSPCDLSELKIGAGDMILMISPCGMVFLIHEMILKTSKPYRSPGHPSFSQKKVFLISID